MKRPLYIIIAVTLLVMAACNPTTEGKHVSTTNVDTTKVNKPAMPDSMTTIFRNLPVDKANWLSKGMRDSLLRFKTDTMPNEGMPDVVFTLDTISVNYMAFEHNEGAHTYVYEELKRFLTSDGSCIAVLSEWGEEMGMIQQWHIKVYDCKGKSVTENKNNILPPDTELTQFLKPGIPDSLKKNVSTFSFNHCFDLLPKSADKIEFIVKPYTENDDSLYVPWLKTGIIEYTWNGTAFTASNK